MSIEMLQTLSLIGYMLSGVFLIITIILFFVLKVPQLIGDVTGATARKAIEDIRRQNEESGDKAYKPSAVNAARGSLTDKISASGKLIKNSGKISAGIGTQKIGTQKLVQEAQMGQETTFITEAASQETTVLTLETIALSPETSVLNTERIREDGFCVDVELGFCESTEIIE